MTASRPPLLFLAQRLPYPPHRGDKIRAFQIIRHFAKNYAVHVGTLIDDPADRSAIDGLRPSTASLHVEDVRYPAAYVAALPAYLMGAPVSFAVFRKSRLQAWVNDICARHRPEVAVVCSSNVADYVLKAANKPATIIVDFADVDSEKWRNYRDSAHFPKSLIYATEARRVEKAERRITSQSSYVSFVTDDETNLFKALMPEFADKAVTVGSGVDLTFYDPTLACKRPYADKFTFVFTGTMNYWPNEQAVIWFTENVLKPLNSEGKNVQFVIAGSNPSRDVLALAQNPDVLVTGRVDDIRPYLVHADVAVTPMLIARGVQNKVLEAMAMAKPVIVSTGALTGIAATPGEHVLLADGAEAWLSAVRELMANPQRRAALGAAARKRIEEEFSWDARLRRFDELIDTCRARRS